MNDPNNDNSTKIPPTTTSKICGILNRLFITYFGFIFELYSSILFCTITSGMKVRYERINALGATSSTAEVEKNRKNISRAAIQPAEKLAVPAFFIES